jgi:hypothetical protein
MERAMGVKLLETATLEAVGKINNVLQEFHPYDRALVVAALLKNKDFAALVAKTKQREALANMAAEARRLDLK